MIRKNQNNSEYCISEGITFNDIIMFALFGMLIIWLLNLNTIMAYVISLITAISIILKILSDKNRNKFILNSKHKIIVKDKKAYEFSDIDKFISLTDYSETDDGIYIYLILKNDNKRIKLLKMHQYKSKEINRILNLINDIIKLET